MTDSAQILIDELDALNSKIDKITLDSTKIEQAARSGGNAGAQAIQTQALVVKQSSERFMEAGKSLADTIQLELIPRVKEERTNRKWLVAKVVSALVVAFGLFASGVWLGATMGLSDRMTFVTSLGQTACEKAGLIYYYNPEIKAQICYEQIPD